MMWCCWMDKEGDGGDPAVIGSTGLKISAMHRHKLLLRQFMAASQPDTRVLQSWGIPCPIFRVDKTVMLDI